MRILTAIAGILICATGAFSFAVYTNPFSDIAFIVGIVMVAAGVLHTVAYLVSGRGENRLTDTALVEGLVTFFYGFAVLNNQVTDQSLTMFFGTWLTICGVTRISQSFYVSRFNPRDWAKIMPLALIATMLGVLMMMPSLLAAVMPLMLVGGAFIVDGFSILVYAMYMKKRGADKARGELEAQQRADAKKALKRTQREQRDKLRSLNKQEREEAQAKIQADRKAYEESKKQEKLAKRKARKEAAVQSATIPLNRSEVEEIIAAAPAEQLKEDENAALAAAASAKEETAPANSAEEAASMADAAKVSFKMPEEIPSISVGDILGEKKSRTEDAKQEQTITAVNLEEIEEGHAVEFEKVELPKLDLSSMKEKNVNRDDVIQNIVSAKLPSMDAVDYTPIDLDELVSEPMAKPVDEEEARREAQRFTQVLKLDWKDAEEVKNEDQ